MNRDVEKLKNLKRVELQQIAAQEGIKANQKSAVIIQQLLAKYPRGVPRKSTPRRSGTFHCSTKTGSRGATEEGEANGHAEPPTGSLPPMESTPKRHSRREDDNYDTESQGEVDSLLRLQSNAPTIPVPTRRSKRSLMTPQKRTEQVNTDVEKWRETATEEDHRTRPLKRARMSDHTIVIATPSNQRKRELEPSLKDVRYVLREIRGHINSLPELQRTIEKTAALLKEAKEQTEVIQAEVEEAVCLRWFVEEDIMKKMKKDRFLTDGTTALGSQSVQGAAWRKWQTAQQELAEHSSAVE